MADPNTIALGIRPPEVGGGAANVNPFAAGLDIMRMQQLANENRKFQLQQQAFQGIGGIMSNHPGDEEGGLREILASPYAPYAGEFVNTVRSSMQALATTNKTLAETGKLNYELGDTAIHGAVKFLAPYYNAVLTGAPESEIQSLKNNAIQQMATTTAGMTKDQQATALTGMRGIFDGLDGNMPPNATPEQIRQLRLSRLGPMLVTSGLDQAAIGNIIPSPTTLNLPQGTSIGVRMPGAAGGGYLENQFVPHTIAPTYGEAGRVQLGLPPPGAPDLNAGSGSYVPAPSVGALPNQPPIGGVNALGGQGQTLPPTPPVGQGSSAPAMGYPLGPAPMAGDNKPLWDENTRFDLIPHHGVMGTGGVPTYDPLERKRAEDAMTHWTGEGRREFEGYNRSLGQLAYINNAFDQLAGTKLQPGVAGELRTNIGNAWNTAIDVLDQYGFDIPKSAKVDPQALASAEDLVKASRLLQFSTVTAAFGAQREAAQTIQAAGRAVPGMENSVLGGKLLVESLRTAAQRGTDLRNFQTRWMQDPRTRNDLTGSEEEFNRQHPAEEYSNQVLDKFGLSKGGFKSLGDVNNAHDNGWIDDKTASRAAMKFTGPASPTPGGP